MPVTARMRHGRYGLQKRCSRCHHTALRPVGHVSDSLQRCRSSAVARAHAPTLPKRLLGHRSHRSHGPWAALPCGVTRSFLLCIRCSGYGELCAWCVWCRNHYRHNTLSSSLNKTTRNTNRASKRGSRQCWFPPFLACVLQHSNQVLSR